MYIFDLGCAPSGDSQTVNTTARVRAPFSSMQSREPSSPNQHQCKARHAQKQDPPVRQPFRIQDDVQICRHACMHECIQNCMHAYIPTYQLPCLPDYLPECSACLPARPPTYIMHTYKHTYICVHKHVSTHSDARHTRTLASLCRVLVLGPGIQAAHWHLRLSRRLGCFASVFPSSRLGPA